MRSARQYNGRVTIGCVPTTDDLEQLSQLGYKTVVDLRSPGERFGETVRGCCTRLGLEYVAIPIARDGITIEAVISFYRTVHAQGSAPLYVFSRQGRKPLAFMLTFDAVILGQSVTRLRERAQLFGLDLEGDPTLADFIATALKEEKLLDEAEALKSERPDLFGK